ncbi:hypothetical protein NFI96_025943 [Prochilodus magdalenae]|nr:hypothetical protein NFI96_025943 [Prochilodus magdalenae]
MILLNSELLASLLTEDHFRCSLCTDVLKEPVSIPCGHSYCKTCIKSYWTKPIRTGSYSCPQCRKRFRTRPTLDPNPDLAKVVQKLQQAGFSPALPDHCYAGPGDVACDFCTGRKLKAVKSCLTCPASYCETHVKQHHTVAALQRHTLVEVTGDLEQRLCTLHHRALEVFCKTDQTFICFMCLMEEHKEHETALATGETYPVQRNTLNEDLEAFKFNSLIESDMEKQMKELLKDNKQLTVKVEILQRAETELAHQLNITILISSDFTSDLVEVAALGRSLDLGMLYDCRDDSFSSDGFLWDMDTLSSMRLSLPQPHRNVKILKGKSLQDRFRALDLTPALRASVISGFIEVTGAVSFLKHPTQSQLQDRVTLHYRTSTRLDMLSHKLLHDKACISVANQKSATHVVVAVLHGEQMFFVFDNTSGNSEGGIKLKDVIKKNITSQNTEELLVSLEQASSSFKCSLYCDAEDFKSPMNVDTAVELFRSLQKQPGPEGHRAVPLKVWLYPLKKLDQTSACIVGSVKEDMLNKAVDVLENLEMNINICEDMMSIYHDLGVSTWYPYLNEALSEFSSLLQQYQSDFQRELASCIKTIREKGEKGEKDLQALLQRNLQSPFNPQNMHHWLLNKDAKVEALKECRAANIPIVKSQEDLKRLVEDSQADTVLCFTLTSLEAEDPLLSALKQHIDLMDTVCTVGTQPLFWLLNISQKILSELRLFLSAKEKNEDLEQTKFIAASGPDFPESSVCLYQFGNIVCCDVKLNLKPELPEIFIIKQTSVTVKLQRPESKSAERYRVEYRAVSCRGKSLSMKWSVIDFSSTKDSCVIVKLTPDTQYQLRYAVMESTSMSDYSGIRAIQTLPRARPGKPKVPKHFKDSLTVSWPSPEADGDSPVLRYMVEYMEAGLECWQLILTEGPECEYTITLPYSTCYRVRVSAVYEEGDTSKPSEETDVPLDMWSIDLRKRKPSIFLEALKFQTMKKPVELKGWSNEESEVRSFLQCLPYISKLK